MPRDKEGWLKTQDDFFKMGFWRGYLWGKFGEIATATPEAKAEAEAELVVHMLVCRFGADAIPESINARIRAITDQKPLEYLSDVAFRSDYGSLAKFTTALKRAEKSAGLSPGKTG